MNTPACTDADNSQNASLAGGDDVMLLATVEKARERYVVSEVQFR